MKKNNGFTLIELLAVILILGIIALIAIPTVNNIIKESKRGAFETTANNIVGAIEDACELQNLKGETITTAYTFTDGAVAPIINVKGKLPTTGTVTVDSSCSVSLNVNNGMYTASKSTLEDSVTVSTYEKEKEPIVYENGTAVYFNPVTGDTCTVGQAVSITGTKTGCMKWYAFNDEGIESPTINLILDHNTTAVVAWNSTGSDIDGPTNALTQLQSDTSSWAGIPTRTDSYSVSNGTATYTINYSTYKARLITAAEIAVIAGKTSFNEVTAGYNSWFYLDSNTQTQTATTQGSSNYDWLFDYTNGCTSYGCSINDVNASGYWTSTAVDADSHYVWSLGLSGSLGSCYVINAGVLGIRPVITISKSNL